MKESQDQRGVASPWQLLRVYRGLHLTLSVTSGVMVAMMMFLTFADVIGRYIFNKPIFGAFELTEVLMGLVIFAGLPLVSRARKHITVDFLSSVLSPRMQRIQAVILEFICGMVATFMSWRVWLYGERLIQCKETTLELQISRGLIAYVMSILLMLTAVAFLVNGWKIGMGPHTTNKEE